jgi:reactive intermediate/imine deaminase
MTTTYGPYSAFKQAGSFYYISGQVGINPTTKQAAPQATEQARQALQNMHEVLKSAKLEPKHVVKTTVYVTNMGDFADVNEVYQEFFPVPRPARATVSVRELPRLAGEVPLLVEVEAVAYKEEK